jgi:hypothetical protein
MLVGVTPETVAEMGARFLEIEATLKYQKDQKNSEVRDVYTQAEWNKIRRARRHRAKAAGIVAP